MFLLEIDGSFINKVQKELPQANLQIDPRPIFVCDYADFNSTFDVSFDTSGKVATITRNNGAEKWSGEALLFRVYDPAKEVVPCFQSTTYTYLGVDGEKAPVETIVGILDSSVRTIKEEAFEGCKNMKLCLMHDQVESIERYAFVDCSAMKSIRLSRKLKHIGYESFGFCESLDALFNPSTTTKIDHRAFVGCRNIRVLHLPDDINIEELGVGIMKDCSTFFEISQVEEYHALNGCLIINNEEVHQSILAFYRNLSPLHRICLDTNVTEQKIHQCINLHGPTSAFTTDHNGMTPLHILAMNPYATPGTILGCFRLNKSAVFSEDNSEMTPIQYLKNHENVERLISLVHALCLHREARLQGKRQDTQELTKRVVVE